MQFYSNLAHWWPLFSPPDHYVEEAAYMLELIYDVSPAPPETLLELGAGGGSNAFHFKRTMHLTLTDLSPGMLAVSRSYNPECDHIAGDMRTIRLNRQFDVVFIHDAINYLTTPADLRAALETAALHCKPGGVLLLAPDHVLENYQPSTEHGGEDGPDGSGLRYLMWSWDPDPADQLYDTAFAFLMRDANGEVHIHREHHEEGLFARADWLDWLKQAGFDCRVVEDPWDRDIFVGLRLID
ncbi:MAG: class I SAM-dependent methyltransferase [Gemmatimonadota bacterium]